MNLKTTLFGVLAALPSLLHVVGVSGIGHIGNTTIDGALASIGVLGLGWYAQDKAKAVK